MGIIFFETGIELDTAGLPTQHQRGRKAQQQHPQTMVEQCSFEHRAGTRIKVVERILRGLEKNLPGDVITSLRSGSGWLRETLQPGETGNDQAAIGGLDHT
nr:hypothetical protein GCM10020185_87260 [Pseudomonas brassicacearum subsp. brassicacearum]